MDLSPEYILMAEKAKEIQENWTPAVGDFTKDHNKLVNIYVMQYPDFPKGFPSVGGLIWLPRQDQLQEMMDDFHGWGLVAILNIGGWDDKFNKENMDKFNTAEQFWLGFVMFHKFNKQWNGQDWEEMK
jgi:hypothetical protein